MLMHCTKPFYALTQRICLAVGNSNSDHSIAKLSIIMKKQVLFLLAAMFIFTSLSAQSSANYAFSTNTTASLANMSGSTLLVGPNKNNTASEVYEIGFDFWFMGVRYTMFSANSNGAIQLGSSAISSSAVGLGFPYAGKAIIAPFMGDIETSATTGKVHFVMSGAYPNRKLIVEFLDMGINTASGAVDGTFQCILSETSGIIQFVYGGMKVSGISGDRTVAIGFASTNVANKVYTINHTTFAINTTATPTVANYTSTGVIPTLNSTADGSRREFKFTPPVLNAPAALSFASTKPISTTLNWTQGSVVNESGFVVYISDDGGATWTFETQTAINGTTAAISPLLPGKNYLFRVYSVSEGALNNTPAANNVTTGACVLSGTNTCTYTGGSTNWSALTWSAGHAPTQCEDGVIIINRTTGGDDETVEINLDADITCKSLTIKNISSTTDRKYIRFLGSGQVILSGDLILQGPGGQKFNRCVFAPQVRTTINGKVVLGSNPPSANEGYTSIGSSSSSLPGQTYILRGDITFNKKGYTTDEHATFIFDKNGTQTIYNNIPPGTSDTLQAVLFEKMIIGNGFAPTIVFAGTGGQDGYIESQSRGGVIMNPNTTLILPENYSLNCLGGSSYFKMGAKTTLKLGGDRSITDPYPHGGSHDFGVAGSNFPGGFTWVIDPTSTIEYNGNNDITQTIYNGINYAKLIISNGSGTGRAAKITTGTVTVNDSTTINSGADVTLGANWSNGGKYRVLTNGGLYCAANVVSGAGSFTLSNFGYLGIGHAQGIASGSTTSGNIQMMGGRSFSTSGNYIYYGLVSQITGNGLPAVCNDLTINNTASGGIVTMSPTTSQLINGTHLISSGIFRVGLNNKVTIGAAATMNATGTGKMEVFNGILEFAGTTGTAQNIDGDWFVNKTISTLIDNNTKGITVSATLNDSLHIASALLYGSGITNSTIATNNNISLLSRDTATARFGEIVTGSGNTITGNVNVERYLPTLRKWRHLAVPISSNQTVRSAWMEKSAAANDNLKPGYGMIVTDDLANAVAQTFDSRSVSGPSVKYYNPASNNFTAITNPSTFNINSQNSYYTFVRGDRSCLPANSLVSTTILRTTGTLKTGNQVFNITAGKMASIGNPYASAIDIRKLDTLNLTSTFYVWDPKLTGAYGLGAYQTLYKNGTDYKILPGGGSYGPLNSSVDTIESGQAFFVRAGPLAGTLTVKENAKTINARSMSRLAPGGENGYISGGFQAVYSLLSLVDAGTGNTLVDGAMVAFDPSFSNGVDYDDALKMGNTSENVSINRNGTLLAIERRQNITAADTLFLNLTGLRVHQYQWQLILDNMDAPGLTAFFIDKYAGTSTPLDITASNTIAFDVVNIPGSYAPDRFMIIFKPAVVLPVRFTSVSAERNADKTITVTWHAQNETAMQNYSIEHSTDGRTFSSAGVQQPGNNNGGAFSYKFIDINASENDNYYRVRGNSLNGRIEYTSIVKVGPLKQSPGMSIYPNPITDNTIHLKLAGLAKGLYAIQVINNLGQLVLSSSAALENTNTVKTIELPENIARGTYSVKVTDEQGKITAIPFILR